MPMLETKRRFAGLDRMQLKYILSVLMVLDHIHYMFSDFAPIPDWFTILGRLVAPTYLFLLAEGFHYTHDRKRFFFRVWLMSFFMESVQFCMTVLGMWNRADGFIPCNGIFMNFPILFCMWQGIDWLREHTPKNAVMGIAALILPWCVYDLLSCVSHLVGNQSFSLVLTWIGYAVIPCWQFITDGGMVYIFIGLVLYLFRGNRKLQLPMMAAASLGLEFFFYGSVYAQMYPDFTWVQMFTNVEYCQWMSVFSIILMLLYNGQKGKGSGRWFYPFYPAHVYLLYGLSCVLYPMLA